MLRKSLGERCSQEINTCKSNREENWTVVPIQKLFAVRSPGTRCWGSPWDEQTPGGHLLVTPHGKLYLKGRHKQHISVSIRVHPWCHLDPLLHIQSGSISSQVPVGNLEEEGWLVGRITSPPLQSISGCNWYSSSPSFTCYLTLLSPLASSLLALYSSCWRQKPMMQSWVQGLGATVTTQTAAAASPWASCHSFPGQRPCPTKIKMQGRNSGCVWKLQLPHLNWLFSKTWLSSFWVQDLPGKEQMLYIYIYR